MIEFVDGEQETEPELNLSRKKQKLEIHQDVLLVSSVFFLANFIVFLFPAHRQHVLSISYLISSKVEKSVKL